jgi:hypothetical protein
MKGTEVPRPPPPVVEAAADAEPVSEDMEERR